jgi:3-hydroxypropanoate dehydrogenase
MANVIDQAGMDLLFKQARTFSKWDGRPVPETLIRELYEALKFGPTSANCCPARFVFVTGAAAKERLRPFLDEGNVQKTMEAPVTVIIGYDLKFYEKLNVLFPHAPGARSWFEGNDAVIRATAFRNGSLQGAYLILAARALGLDCGPMSGFNADGVKREFFPDGAIEPNFLCNLGYGDRSSLHPRSPRLGFDEACRIL